MKQRQVLLQTYLSRRVKAILGIMIVKLSNQPEEFKRIENIFEIAFSGDLFFQLNKLNDAECNVIYEKLSVELDRLIKVDNYVSNNTEESMDINSILKPKHLFFHLFKTSLHLSKKNLTSAQRLELKRINQLIHAQNGNVKDQLEDLFQFIDHLVWLKEAFSKSFVEYLMPYYCSACKLYNESVIETNSLAEQLNSFRPSF